MKQEEINRCQIQQWYPKFNSSSIKTIILELPEVFVDYLLDDSGPFRLPSSISNDDALPKRIRNPHEDDDYEISEGSSDEEEESRPLSFPDLEQEVNESIAAMGGAIFPKLNWSSPKDASWISTSGTLRCTSFMEMVLLLRSSDSLIHDLCHAYDSCSDKTSSRPPAFYLALRKWYPSLEPQMEFRCYVRCHNLVGICQRETTTFYPGLVEKKIRIEELIGRFFRDKVRMKFESDRYSFDVYVTKDERVKIVDFNPWGDCTLPLLFTWEELESGEELGIRIVESQSGIRPGLKTAVPRDYLDISPGGAWDQLFKMADHQTAL